MQSLKIQPTKWLACEHDIRVYYSPVTVLCQKDLAINQLSSTDYISGSFSVFSSSSSSSASPFPPPKQKSPSNLYLEVSLDNFFKSCKQKSVTGMISLWQFSVNSHKVLSESFSKHSVGLSVCIHQNGYSYILATSFIASFFLGIIHGCSWKSHDSPANYETSLDWAKKKAVALISIGLVHILNNLKWTIN